MNLGRLALVFTILSLLGFGGAGHHVGPCAAADAADVDGRVAVVGGVTSHIL